MAKVNRWRKKRQYKRDFESKMVAFLALIDHRIASK